ncbi:Uncharacterized protein Adt_03630 [Abeliophyllum distichum]|uniref:Uncharacterized protein n=1 Tax=Abeliophyllum distichum TaxID=126358 RepID=A0ABD1VZ17_9LAMI
MLKTIQSRVKTSVPDAKTMDLATITRRTIETMIHQGQKDLQEPPIQEINTIIGRPYVGGHTMNSQSNYAKAAREESMDNCSHYLYQERVQTNIDDESTVNILFGSTFEQMDVDHKLTAISELLFSFSRDCLIPQGRITFIVDYGEPPYHLKKFIQYIVVDTHFAYHGVLGKPVLKDLQAVTSIYYLVMKFPTPSEVAKVCGNQTEAMSYYMNATKGSRA